MHRNSTRQIYADDNNDGYEDEDVVFGSSSTLNSDERFEQSYLAMHRSDLGDNGRYSQSKMSTIREKDEQRSRGVFICALI